MKLHLDESSVLPGSSLTGFVVGLDADALVALEAVETTKGLVGDEASATSTVGSVIVPVGSNGRFTLAVPHDAVPQFHADFNWKGRSAYSRRSWNVRARSGDEFEAVERIELLARLDNAADPPLGIEFEEITAFVEKRRRSDLWQSGAAMLLFLPIGLLCVAAGIWLLMSPPEGQEATGFGWAAIVFGLFTLGFVMWWFLNKVRPVPLKGVSIESVTPAVRRGGQIDVQLLMEPGKEVRVSHLLLVYGTSSIEYRDSGLGPGEIAGLRRESTSWWDSPAYEAAQTATSERPVATFDVPGDIPPTYGGDIIICVHLIRVHKPGVKSTRLSTQRLERQVIVYA